MPDRAVQIVDPTQDSAWDAHLAACPDATFFHGSAWLRVLRETYGYTPVFFVRREAESIKAVLPLMEINSWLTGRRGVGLPFTDECPPLGGGFAGAGELFPAALRHARERGWKYLECRGGRELLGGVPASTTFFGHRLDLRGGEAALFAGTESSVRRAVRKAEQSGLTVTFSRELAEVRVFYALLCQTRRRHGLPAQPFRFFAHIHRHILAPNHGQIVIARQGSRAVAAAVFFHFGGQAIYKFGASDERLQHLRANNRVMWDAIKWHAGQGFTSLDFGRTSLDNAGLRKFKLGWGAVERRIDYVRHDLRTGSFATVPDAAAGWHNHIFRLLPVSLSRLAGSVLYRHVA